MGKGVGGGVAYADSTVVELFYTNDYLSFYISSCQLTSRAPSCGSCLEDGGLLLGHQARVQACGLDLEEFQVKRIPLFMFK